jgi:phosphoribosylanthranilate isomerase
MKTWIKICGNTNLEDCELAIEAGCDALGFLFAESPRRVEPAIVARITKHLPKNIEKFGVFVNESEEDVLAAVEDAYLTGVQLHGDETPAYVKKLLTLADARPLKIMKTVPATEGKYHGLGTFAGGENLVDMMMVDSGSKQIRGGTGVPFDWLRANEFIMELERHSKVVIAGGLNPGNVSAAVSLFRPFGVDVVTGIEESFGKKDPVKLRAFIEAVKRADGQDSSGMKTA